CSCCAARLGRKDSSLDALSTLSLVVAETSCLPLSALDAVATETPAASATSRSRGPPLSMRPLFMPPPPRPAARALDVRCAPLYISENAFASFVGPATPGSNEEVRHERQPPPEAAEIGRASCRERV